MDDEPISDRDFANAAVVGLARLVNKLTFMLVEGGALKRETVIKDLQEYRGLFKDPQASHQMTEYWVSHLIRVLEADPARPPSGDVHELFPKKE